MRLKDKVAIVTGGGTGIGRSIALLFAKEGASVVVCGRRKDVLDSVVLEIENAGGKSIAICSDVSSFSQVSNLAKTTLEKFGSIDVLVNNAGIALSGDTVSGSEEDWDKVINTDLKGVWLCSKAILPQMIKQGKGKIVNMASIAGLIGFERSAAYGAAKGGVINLTREMALDYSSKGINVNAIAPGFIETDMTKDMLSDESMRKDFLSKTPVGRFGKPEDIAFATLYLASSESDFVSGEILVVDGGFTVR